MKRVLFLTESYHHSPSPNGICVEKIARLLTERGHSVSVLTYKNQYQNQYQCIDGIKVYRSATYLEWRILYNEQIPVALKRLLGKFVLFFKYLLIPFHPLKGPLVLYRLKKKAEKIIHDEHIDTVIGVYRDYETAQTVTKLKQKYPYLKTIIYSLDSLSDGVCSNPLVSCSFHKKRCQALENRFVKVNDVFCPMMCHKEIFENDRFKSVREKIQYMDIPSIVDKSFAGIQDKQESDTLLFMFTGMLSETNADCRFFLKVIPYLAKRIKMRVELYGGISEALSEEISKSGLLDTIIFIKGRVDQETLRGVRSFADLFLSFGNEHFAGIPCKIFEYIPTGKPILHFYKIEKDASLPYLQKYPKSILIKQEYGSEERIADTIYDRLLNLPNAALTKQEILERYKDNTPYPFVELVERM